MRGSKQSKSQTEKVQNKAQTVVISILSSHKNGFIATSKQNEQQLIIESFIVISDEHTTSKQNKQRPITESCIIISDEHTP